MCLTVGVIRFMQADEILSYLAEETSSRVKLFCCTTMHVRQTQAFLREQFRWDIFEHPPYSPDLAPSGFLPVKNWITLLVNASQMMKT